MPAVALGVFDILAVDLSSSTAEILPAVSDVEVVEVQTFEEVAAFERTSALGWGYPLPSDDDIRSAHRQVTGFIPCALRRRSRWDGRFHPREAGRAVVGCSRDPGDAGSRCLLGTGCYPTRRSRWAGRDPRVGPCRTHVLTHRSAAGLSKTRRAPHISCRHQLLK